MSVVRGIGVRAEWLQRLAAGLAGFAIILAVWELIVRVGWVDPFFASSPTLVWQTLVEDLGSDRFTVHVRSTLISFGMGFGIAAAAGVPLGFLAGRYRRLDVALEGPVWFLYNAPSMAFYPLFIIWFGFGRPTVVALAALLAFFPIYANASAGVRGVDPTLIKAARSFGAGELALFAKVILPASIPMVLAGFRLGLGLALLGAVVGEIFGSNSGLGYGMHHAASFLRTTDYFVMLVLTVAIGVLANEALRWAERRLSTWRG